ncbi:PIG-L deacetylase family protein [Paenibacillus rigui]|uniref:PIG-L domain-containing protein n=1 Tax=Paenibacillus rigui TaxID=554312 RepID=A0A229UR45_9BACL|nr:PIG-L family deacetylase [Paenibacillus rigui]OXM85966.1 PIG-L domain-containing protein [Paenibacillus rigui]
MSKKWLFVFAHPDDESFAAGGTMAKARHSGHEVYLICATSGCKGKSGAFQFDCREQLARHREEELKAACAFLGVTNIVLYRHPDGALHEQGLDSLAEQIKESILAIQPDIIVTFPPDGVTGHLDHIAISKATELAVTRSEGKYPSGGLPAFYYNSIPHYYDHCKESGPEATCCITAKVDISEFRQHKGRALQAYKSQIYSVNRAYPGVMHADYTVIGNYEYYTLVRANGQSIERPTGKDLTRLPTLDLI